MSRCSWPLAFAALLCLSAAVPAGAQTGPPGPPTNLQVSVSGNVLSLSWAAPVTGAPPTNYQILARNTTGALITPPVNAWPTPSFTGAVPNGVYVISVRAQNAAGFGPETPSETVTVPSTTGGPGAPGVPTNLQASASGNTLSVSWGPPTTGGAPTGYTLIARDQAGTLLATQPVWPTPSFVAAVPNGIYALSVRASNAAGTSAETAPVLVTVPSSPPPGAGVPGPPANLQTSVVGTVLNVSWSPPTTGGAPTGYILVARTTLGALITTQPVGTITTFAATVPNGTYVISVYATNAAGAGAESVPSTAVVPSGSVAPPGSPRNLSASQTGGTATFAWSPPAAGGPVTTYVLRAATTPGGAAAASLSVGGTVTQTTVPGVPPGVYYVTVVATNAAGTSLPSNTATLTVAAGGGSRSTLNPAGVPTFIEARTSMRFANGQYVQVFDDFTFPASTAFRQVAWQGIYCVEDNAASAPAPTATAFIVSVYPDQGGRPNLNASLGSFTVPVAQVNQTFNGVFVGARCGVASSTRWSLYTYATTLPAAFNAQPGVRYWLSVEAITPSWAVIWAWRSGTVDTRVALQRYADTYTTLTLDRAFALAP